MSDGPDDDTLVLVNHHTGRMPEPPPGAYVGYFVNEHGEQSIYVHDPAVGAPMLYPGDAEWEEYQVDEPGEVAGLILTDSEAAWLRACWHASTRWTVPRREDA